MEHPNAVRRFSAIISAGGQAGEDLTPLLGVSEKCAGLVGGVPMVRCSVDAALGAGANVLVVVGGGGVRDALGEGAWRFAEPGSNPVESAANGAKLLPPDDNVLFLPGDLPLVRSKHVTQFLDSIPFGDGAWLAAGTAYDHEVEMTFGTPPGMQFMNVHPGKHAGGGLFAASPSGFTSAVAVLSEFAGDRKSQFRMARKFGILGLLRYFVGLMTVDAAEKAAGRLFGCRTHLVSGCAAETVLDIDTASDLAFVEKVLENYPTTGAVSST